MPKFLSAVQVASCAMIYPRIDLTAEYMLNLAFARTVLILWTGCNTGVSPSTYPVTHQLDHVGLTFITCSLGSPSSLQTTSYLEPTSSYTVVYSAVIIELIGINFAFAYYLFLYCGLQSARKHAHYILHYITCAYLTSTIH